MVQPIQPLSDGSDVTLGELARGLNSIRDQISAIRTDAVLRVEFEPRMTAMDREIRDLKDALSREAQARVNESQAQAQAETSRRPKWTEITAAVCAIATIVMALVLALQVAK